MITEQRLDEIEEWIGTPESFFLAKIFGDEVRAEHELKVSAAIKELIAEVRALQRENNRLRKSLKGERGDEIDRLGGIVTDLREENADLKLALEEEGL